MNIPLKEYVELAIRYKDYAIVDNGRKIAMETEDSRENPTLFFRQAPEGIATNETLWQAWRLSEWLRSPEHRAELVAVSERGRISSCARNEAKAKVITKLRFALGLNETLDMMAIVNMLLINKTANVKLLASLGLSAEEIEIL